MPKESKLVSRRPAETGAIAGAIALLAGYFFGIEDPEVLLSLGVVIGALPAGITWVVEKIRYDG